MEDIDAQNPLTMISIKVLYRVYIATTVESTIYNLIQYLNLHDNPIIANNIATRIACSLSIYI